MWFYLDEKQKQSLKCMTDYGSKRDLNFFFTIIKNRKF